MTTAHPWLARYANGDAAVQFSPAFEDGLSLFRHAVATNPDGPAIYYFDRVLSYAEVDRLSDAFAGWLTSSGINAGDRVALYLQNVPQFPICLLGAWKIGAIGVSINPMNRSRELTLLLRDSRARVLVAHRDLYEDVAREVLKEFPNVSCVTTSAREFQTRNDARIFAEPDRTPPEGVTELADALRDAPHAAQLRREMPPQQPAIIVYTSGTTGIPKGAVVTHWNFASDAELWRLWANLPNGGPVLAIAPLFHITGLVGHLGLAIATCAPVILMMRFHPDVVAEAAQEREAKFVVGAITAFIAIMNSPRVTPQQLASLEHVHSGGAPVPASVAAEFEGMFGLAIRNCYGLTESTSLVVSVPRIGRAPIDANGALSIGVPVIATEARIADDNGESVRPNEVGEIMLRGPQIVAGYWQRPEETASTFVDGWLKTGDMGYMNEEGWIFIVDRKKDMIIASGYKVWPKEVEDVIYTHPAIREAAVVGVQDDYRGETVKAVVSLKPGQSLEPESLIEYCKERMAAYKYPRVVVILDELPKTATGKILRRELR